MSGDPYCYPGTNVLVNKFGIRDKDELAQKEAAISQLRADDAGKLKGPFNADRLKATHRVLFGDLYTWAGKARQNTGKMHKDREGGYTVVYGDSAHVEANMPIVFAELEKENYLKGLPSDQFASRLAYYYSELDSIHCFRDGNSRTLRRFTSDLAAGAGYQLDWSRAGSTEEDHQKLYVARDWGVMRRETERLTAIISKCLVTPELERGHSSESLREIRSERKKARTKIPKQGIER